MNAEIHSRRVLRTVSKITLSSYTIAHAFAMVMASMLAYSWPLYVKRYRRTNLHRSLRMLIAAREHRGSALHPRASRRRTKIGRSNVRTHRSPTNRYSRPTDVDPVRNAFLALV